MANLVMAFMDIVQMARPLASPSSNALFGISDVNNVSKGNYFSQESRKGSRE
jgi:hypothetical protein